MRLIFPALLAVPLFATSALAAQSGANFSVSTEVVGECNVRSTPVVFTGFNGASPVTAQGTVTVQCTGGLNYFVALDQGQHYGVGATVDRTMVNGTHNLFYRLYQPDGSTQWGDSGYGNTFPAGVPMAGVGNGYDQTMVVNGELYGGIPVVGTYNDAVTVTVNF